MTDRYVGPGGNDGNSGLTWALRKLTLNGIEDTPVVIGDNVYVAPGVYREQLTCDVSGGNTYAAGTVTVTNDSTTVTGAGTAFLANVAIADMFHVTFFASGADGVANGTATFTSAGGNFQANMVGKVIQIMTRGAYRVGAVAAANSITLLDPNGLGWPGAAGGLSYSVMSGEGPYEIDSITDGTNFELTCPWCGPTLTGLVYLTYTPIRYIGDVSGRLTDGIGGIVRITGSDNDQTPARNYGAAITTRGYRLFCGFHFDTFSTSGFWQTTGSFNTIEECTFVLPTIALLCWGTATNLTVRRCMILGGLRALFTGNGADVDNTGHVYQNNFFITQTLNCVQSDNIGGITVRDCSISGGWHGVVDNVAPALGQTIDVFNCLIWSSNWGVTSLPAIAGDVTEDYNTFYGCSVDRLNVAVGANSVAFSPQLQPPVLLDGFKYPWSFGQLAEWSQVRGRVGFMQMACRDLHGFARPVTDVKKSWGALQFTDMERDIGTTHRGSTASVVLHDAARQQFTIPVSNINTTISVFVHREANYAGTNPQLVIKQPGQADRTTTDVAAASQWNRLSDNFTPAALPPYVVVELVSNNTAAAGNYDVFFDSLLVRSRQQDTGAFEHWVWDRQPMPIGKVTPAVKKDTDGGLYSEINAAGDLLRLA